MRGLKFAHKVDTNSDSVRSYRHIRIAFSFCFGPNIELKRFLLVHIIRNILTKYRKKMEHFGWSNADL